MTIITQSGTRLDYDGHGYILAVLRSDAWYVVLSRDNDAAADIDLSGPLSRGQAEFISQTFINSVHDLPAVFDVEEILRDCPFS